MRKRVLERRNLEVSEIGLGGEWFNGLTPDESKEIIDEAINQGINFIDIFMPQAPTRDNIGYALKGRREKFVIQGHLCTVYEDGQYERTRDINKTIASFEDLLKRLDTNYIDIGMIHYVDSDDDYSAVFDTEIIEYAKKLKEEGTIGCIGMSSHNPRIAQRAVESGCIDVLMFSINPAYDMETSETDIFDLMDYKGFEENGWVTDPKRQELYDTCERLGVGITVMKPLGAGTLLKSETSPFEVALTVEQCIQYCLDRNGVKVVLVGCHTKEEVTKAANHQKCSEEEKKYSHIFASGKNIKMTGRCMYCNHCQPCPVQIDIAAVTKFLDLASIQDEVPDSVRQHYFSMKTNASHCIQCGKCEPNCPFGVEIRKNMRKATEVFSDERK